MSGPYGNYDDNASYAEGLSSITTYPTDRVSTAGREARADLVGMVDRAEKAVASLAERIADVMCPTEPTPPDADVMAKLAQPCSDEVAFIRSAADRIQSLCQRVEAMSKRVDL